ncbi:hypothetical protein F4778DRAFT_786573 [Xylariomycetidae sp. FL2044]|nr:hypothetical protein F4778DRAFT_786573 [Xylariomycetidae sp. FL2044]
MTAKAGGDALTKTAIDALWEVMDFCDCTSIVGPELGRGHHYRTGRREIHKDSDLWWAIQGAGYVLGIGTSITLRTYEN